MPGPRIMLVLAAVLAVGIAMMPDAGAQPFGGQARKGPPGGQKAPPRQAQSSYATPEAAAKALYDAAKADDLRGIHAVLGPGSGPVIFSGDRVADDAMRNDLVAAWDRSLVVEREGDAKATLLVGPNRTPFPFPLVREGGAWRFDAQAGAEEVVNRRIGENELSAIKVCLAYVDAQREYAEQDRNGDGVVEYAQRMVSTPGKRDGLFWPAGAGEPPSPLGPLAAEAFAEGYGRGSGMKRWEGPGPDPNREGGRSPEETMAQGPRVHASAGRMEPRGPRPYHGYTFRILKAQGAAARGGAYDYVVNGRMVGGFALVAYPARYGVSGVMTFVCNHDGVVHEKDLGEATSREARAMAAYDPDASWKKSNPQ